MSVYEIRFWREVWNSLLHILIGMALAHVFLSPLPLWAIIVILLVLGIGREYWQYKRNKIQPLYIQIIDSIGFSIGGIIWWLIINQYNIQVDLL